MYLAPAEDDPILFGDIFKADWFFDSWLQDDAVMLGQLTAKGGHRAWGAHVWTPESNALLAHGRKPLASLLLNDDCYLETVFKRRREGELHFAPIMALPDEPEERQAQLKTDAFSKFPLEPAAEFAGGIAQLNCPVQVSLKNKAAVAAFEKLRSVRLDPRGRALLEARWGAHAVRRGPVVARSVGVKLDELAGDGGAAKKGVEKLLATAWSVEGGIADLIDTAAEQGGDPGELIDGILERIDLLAEETATARKRLASAAAAISGSS